jgi:hypothetical protein
MPRFLNKDGYEPIPGQGTMFRAPEGNIVHLSHEEQLARGWERRGPPLGEVEKTVAEPRDRTELPLDAWGRHELEQEVINLRVELAEFKRTLGPCGVCRGSQKNPLGLGDCVLCLGTGHRIKEVERLYSVLDKARTATEEAMQKADSHRRQRDELLSKLALRGEG